MKTLRRLFCGLRGHDLLYAIDDGRGPHLACASCPYRSPGFKHEMMVEVTIRPKTRRRPA